MRVLLVEDSRATRMILRATLESLRLETLDILEAVDGLDALDLLRKAEPRVDLVLADWEMPRMDGLDFLQRLKASADHAALPVIMVTSRSKSEQVGEALRHGARDYIVKPFNSAVLLEKLRPILGEIEGRRVSSVDAEKPFFQRLPAEMSQALTRRGAERSVPKGGPVVSAGKPLDALLILLGGELRPVPDEGLPPLRIGDIVEARAFLSNAPAARSWIAAAESTLLVVDRFVLADTLRKFPTLSQHLGAAPPAEPSTAPLSGALSDVPVPELLRRLSTARKTGLLRLTNRERSAGVFLQYGEIKHAWADELRGEDAFHALLTWRDALFVFEPGRREELTTIRTPLTSLLAESQTKSPRRD